MLEPYASRLRLIQMGDAWFPVCRSEEVKAGKPHAERLSKYQLVLFRDQEGKVRALEDRCPHRGVPLSLGDCVNGRLVCSYHGLVVDGNGRFGNLCMPTFAAKEYLGLVWIYAGDSAYAEETPLPFMPPFGTGERVDTVLRLDMKTHWSLVLDNGVDLTHDFLHRHQPLFFKVLKPLGVTEDAEGCIEVSYHARMRDEFNRMREGKIVIQLRGPLVKLDFGGQPIVHSVATPRTGNGREITQWWFVSLRPTMGMRWITRLMLPWISRVILAAFREDKLMLEHEADVVFNRRFPQTERNSIVRDVQSLYQKQLVAKFRTRLAGLPIQERPTPEILGEVERGELAVVHPDHESPMTHEELRQLFGTAPTVRLHCYWQYALLTL